VSGSGPTRRHLLLLGAGAAVGAVAGLGLGRARVVQAAPALLRPPGALAGDAFLAACIRCSLCVEACPYGTLHPSDLGAGAAAGAPTFEARSTPCYLCQGYEGARCIPVCPTGALRPLGDFREARMGVAVLDETTCWAYHRKLCRACWHACPYPNEAIRFDRRLRPVVVADACIGCGLCEHACPTEERAAIVVEPLPREAARA